MELMELLSVSPPSAEPFQRTPKKRSQKPDAVTIKVKLKNPVDYEKRHWFCDFGAHKPMEGVNPGERVLKLYEDTIKDLREIMSNKGVPWNCCEDANVVITAFLGNEPILKVGFRRPEGKRIEILFTPVASPSKAATLPNELIIPVVRSSNININTAQSEDDPMPSLTPILSNVTAPLLYHPLPAAKAKARKRPSVIKTGKFEDGPTTSLNMSFSNATTPLSDEPTAKSEYYPITLMTSGPSNVALPCFNEPLVPVKTKKRKRSSVIRTENFEDGSITSLTPGSSNVTSPHFDEPLFKTKVRKRSSSIKIENSEDGSTTSLNLNLSNVTTPLPLPDEPANESEDYPVTLMIPDPGNLALPFFNELMLQTNTEARNQSSGIMIEESKDGPTNSFNPNQNNVITPYFYEPTEKSEDHPIILMIPDPSIKKEKFEDGSTTSLNLYLSNVTTPLPDDPANESEYYPINLMTERSNVAFPCFDEPQVKTETSNRSLGINTENSEDGPTTSFNLNLSNVTTPFPDVLTEKSEYYPIPLITPGPSNVTFPCFNEPLVSVKTETSNWSSDSNTEKSKNDLINSFTPDLSNVTTPLPDELTEKSEDYSMTSLTPDSSNVTFPSLDKPLVPAKIKAKKRSSGIKKTSLKKTSDSSNVTFPCFNEPLVSFKTETSNWSSDSNTEKSKNDLINSFTPDLSNVTTSLPDELTEKSEDYSMTSLTPDSSNVTFPSLDKPLVPAKIKVKKRSSGIKKTSLDPGLNNAITPLLKDRLLQPKAKARKRSSSIKIEKSEDGPTATLNQDSNNVTTPNFDKPLVPAKINTRKRSSAIKTPKTKVAKPLTAVSPNNVTISLHRSWFPSQEEQTELYKSDSFVVEADQISRPAAQTVLWRIFEDIGIISLQKYEGRDINGRVFHWVQNNVFRIVETKDRAFFIKYHPVFVKVLQDTERVKVIQYFKVDQIVPNILRMRATQGLFYDYKVLIHMMIVELLNWPPGFIKSRVSANSEKCEEYFQTSWDVTESAINDRAKVITAETRLASGIVAPFRAYPITKVKSTKKDGGKFCVACLPKKRNAGYQVEFSGVPYEQFTFEDLEGNFEPPEVYFCWTCTPYFKILHKLLSYKWWLFRTIRMHLIHYTQELGPGQKLEKHDTTECFLKDHEWLLRCFLEFQVTLAKADKIIQTLQKESRRQVII